MFRMFRRGLVFIFTVTALLGAVSVPAWAQGTGGADAVVNSPILTLHATPNQYSPSVATLENGDRLKVDGRDSTSRWLHVITEKDNRAGWVLRGYLIINANLIISDLPILDSGSTGGSTGGGSTNPANPTAPANGPTPVATAQGANPPAPVVRGRVGGGFALGGQVQDLNGGTVNAMRTAGMTWVKRQVYAGDGGAGGLIGQAHSLGFKILLSVVGNRDSVTSDGYQNDYANYVGGLAASGADGLEIWNEMNIDREWPTGQINPASYVRLLSKAYNAIKRANPGTMVITGALAPTGAEGAFGLDRVWNDDHYYSGMAAAGAGSYADCIGAHYNEGIVSPNQTSGDPRGNYGTRYFSTMVARARRSFGGIPVCFTELGFLTPEGYGPLPGNFAWAQNTTVAQQAAWLAQAAVRGSASGVRLIIVFNVDFTGYGADPQAGYAMIRPGGACLACAALGRVTH